LELTNMFKLCRNSRNNGRRNGFAFGFVLLALLLVACVAAPSQAGDFSLTINRDLTHLPSFVGTPLPINLPGPVVATQNNRPFIELKNTSTVPLTNFEMTIAGQKEGTDIFHFVSPGIIKVPPSPNGNPSGVPMNATLTDDNDVLHIDFGSGLLPGDFVQFQIQFASDSNPTAGLPSYQVALFNKCCDGSTMGSPSEVSVTFDGGPGTITGVWPIDTFPLQNCVYAPPGSPNPPPNDTWTPEPVPEPAALLLGMLAGCGFAALRVRRCGSI
jgi:hypothetical protein